MRTQRRRGIKGLAALLIVLLILGMASGALAEEAAAPEAGATVEPPSIYLSQGMQIHPLYQRDYRDAVVRVRGLSRTVATSGCGAVCVSMVVAYLTGNSVQTPESLFLRAAEMGEYAGWGLKHETLSALLDENGVRNEWIPNSAEDVERALREGKPVIAHVGPGIFTNAGHYVVLRGIADDGLILVNDPASPERSAGAYPLDKIVRQARREDSFLVCWTDSSGLDITDLQVISIDNAESNEPVPALIAAARALAS